MAGLPSDYKKDDLNRQRSEPDKRGRRGKRKKNKEKEKAQIVSSTTKKLNEIERLLQDIDVKVETTQRKNSQKLNDFAQVMLIHSNSLNSQNAMKSKTTLKKEKIFANTTSLLSLQKRFFLLFSFFIMILRLWIVFFDHQRVQYVHVMSHHALLFCFVLF